VERLGGRVSMTGFVTDEIREGGRRKGFRGTTLDGDDFLLAHVDSPSAIRVGPYGVELEGLETIGVPALEAGPGTGLVVLDEIGKMESFSDAFRQAVERLLASDTPLLATVAAHGVGFVKRVRRDNRVELVRMSRRSRDSMVGEMLRKLERSRA
jgi:nucleoside-triphosphatase